MKYLILLCVFLVGCTSVEGPKETRMWHREDNPECLEHYSARFGKNYAKTVCVEFWEEEPSDT